MPMEASNDSTENNVIKSFVAYWIIDPKLAIEKLDRIGKEQIH